MPYTACLLGWRCVSVGPHSGSFSTPNLQVRRFYCVTKNLYITLISCLEAFSALHYILLTANIFGWNHCALHCIILTATLKLQLFFVYIALHIPEANWFCDALHHGYMNIYFQSLECNNFPLIGTFWTWHRKKGPYLLRNLNLLFKGVKVLEIAVGAVFALTGFRLGRISIRDLVADGKSLVRNSGLGVGVKITLILTHRPRFQPKVERDCVMCDLLLCQHNWEAPC